MNRSKTRRTKGLTREDMAELTGVSFKWYTLFESGASKGVSRKLAERVAQVLALGAEESHYLFGLLGFAESYSATPGAEPTGLVRLMHRMDSVAAALYSPMLDLLDCNERYLALFPPPDVQQPFGRNLLWRLFFDASYRAAWVDWPHVAQRTVAEFKTLSAYARHTIEYLSLRKVLDAHEDFLPVWTSETSFPSAPVGPRFGLVTPGGERVEIEPLVLRSMSAPGVHLGTLTIVDPER